MQNVKGFVEIYSLTNNESGVVSRAGELSAQARTYSKDIRAYTSNDVYDIVLSTFYREGTLVAASDGSSELVSALETTSHVDKMLTVATWVVREAFEGTAPPTLIDYIDRISQYFQDEAPTITVGTLVVSDDGTVYPSWVKFIYPNDVEFRLWFTNNEFMAEYDEYETYPVLPVENMDNLYTNYQVGQPIIEGLTVTHMINRSQEAIGDNPDTHTIAVEYQWHDHTDTSLTLTVPFIITTYGRLGTTLDIIRETLADAILEQSAYTREQWTVVFPEIFSPDEIVFVPRWVSVLDEYDPLNDDIYSPVVSPDRLDVLTLQYLAPLWTTEHATTNVSYVPLIWRGIGCLVCANPRVDITESSNFSDMYPDYLLAATTSPDFQRMSPKTQALIVAVNSLITIAETDDQTAAVPVGYSRVTRNGHTYITVKHEDFTILMLTKSSYTVTPTANGANK